MSKVILARQFLNTESITKQILYSDDIFIQMRKYILKNIAKDGFGDTDYEDQNVM